MAAWTEAAVGHFVTLTKGAEVHAFTVDFKHVSVIGNVWLADLQGRAYYSHEGFELEITMPTRQTNTVAVCGFCGAAGEWEGRDESSKSAARAFAAEHEHCAVDIAPIDTKLVPPVKPLIDGHPASCTCDRCF